MPARPTTPSPDQPVFSVRRLNREAKRLLETGLRGIWVGGEISGFVHHGSGHMYFTLKDSRAEVRCAMFRGAQRNLRFEPANGQQVVLQGTISIYEARGSYQIIVEQMEEAGEGLLRRQFEELKARLQAEGLFATEHKQSLPALPRCIGVVTSPSGAAIRDILNVLRRRYPLAEVIVYPTAVQGAQARDEIAAAIATANQRDECDVLIVARGGGSPEDLWSFNEEVVARAIFASRLPIVAGIGHEVDVSIADLVADLRAPTPSGAAELIAPDKATLQKQLRDTQRRGSLALQRRVQYQRNEQRAKAARLQRLHPGTVLRELQQRADEMARALVRNLQRALRQEQSRCSGMRRRLVLCNPTDQINALGERRLRASHQLLLALRRLQQTRAQEFAALVSNLQAVSPLGVLERGYAVLRRRDDRRVIRDSAAVKPGEEIEAQLAKGIVTARVTGKR